MGNCSNPVHELDTRCIETSYSEKPFCLLGLIKTSLNNYSNGILINHNVVLTSSYITFHPITNEQLNPKEIKFIPAQKDKHFDRREVQVSDFYIHKIGLTDSNHKYTWCLLFLSEPIGLDINRIFYKSSYYKICIFNENLIKEKRVHLLYFAENKSYSLSEAKGFIEKNAEYYTYKIGINTNGAPLFIEINGKKKLFSIDISGVPTETNKSYIFNNSDIKMIKTLIKQLKLKEMWEKKIPIKEISRIEVKEIKKSSNEMLEKIISNNSDKPYCYMGIIKKKGFCTTGILVEKNIVLTSSRILFDSEKSAYTNIDNLIFSIPLGKTIFQSKIKDYYYPDINRKPLYPLSNNDSPTPDDINDWALLFLETSRDHEQFNGKEFKYYKMIELDDDEIEGKFVNVYYYSKWKNRLFLNEAIGKININKNYFSYPLKNFSKNISLGGPILLEVNEKKYIIGFNSTYSNTCIGHRFTHNELSEIMKQIKNLRIDNFDLSMERKSNVSLNKLSMQQEKTLTLNPQKYNKSTVSFDQKILFSIHLKNYFGQNDVILVVGINEMIIWKLGKATMFKKINNIFSQKIDVLIHLLSYNYNNDVIAVCDKQTLSLFNLSDEKIILVLSLEKKPTSIVYHPESNSIISGYSDGILQCWDLNTKLCIKNINAHYYSFECMCMISEYMSQTNNFLATGGKDQIIYIWDLSSFERYKSLKGHQNTIVSLHYSEVFREKDIIFSGSIRNIKVWKLSEGLCIKTIDVYNKNVDINFLYSVYSNRQKKGYILCGNYFSEIMKIIDIKNMKHIRKIKKGKKENICIVDVNEFNRLFYLLNDIENNLIIIENEF